MHLTHPEGVSLLGDFDVFGHSILIPSQAFAPAGIRTKLTQFSSSQCKLIKLQRKLGCDSAMSAVHVLPTHLLEPTLALVGRHLRGSHLRDCAVN